MKKQFKNYPNYGIKILSYITFITLGKPDGLLSVAWPSIRESFNISLNAVGLLITASLSGYLISSFLSGMFITRFGVGNILAASCALTGIGLIAHTLYIIPVILILLFTNLIFLYSFTIIKS